MKLLMAYLTSLLDEYITQCSDRLNHEGSTSVSWEEEFSEEGYLRRKPDYEVKISDPLFHQKIGQHRELMEILMILGFRLETEDTSSYLKLDKTEGNLALARDFIGIFS